MGREEISMSPYKSDEPPERTARPGDGRAALRAETVSACDPTWQSTLESWLAALPGLTGLKVSPLTASKLADSHRICQELLDVLRGAAEGEGRSAERSLFAVRALGRVQAISSMFACPKGVFIELIATAPWNLIGRGDPPDPRTVHGAGSALVKHAVAWSESRGSSGRVALQAGSGSSVGFYAKLGFRPLRPEDDPLTLVPPGERGWSPEILRVARGTPGPDEARSPWLLHDARGLDRLARAEGR
jgi:hypothetical protein